MSQASRIVIVCFGDSSDRGVSVADQRDPHGEGSTPYGVLLQERIGSAGQSFQSAGICGELTGEMVMRFRKGCPGA